MKNYGLFMNGEWVQSSSGKTFTTKNPADGQTLATFQEGAEKDVMKAVEAAERTFPQWRNFPPPKRGEILLKAASLRLKYTRGSRWPPVRLLSPLR